MVNKSHFLVNFTEVCILGEREKIRQKWKETPKNFPPCGCKIDFSRRRGGGGIIWFTCIIYTPAVLYSFSHPFPPTLNSLFSPQAADFLCLLPTAFYAIISQLINKENSFQGCLFFLSEQKLWFFAPTCTRACPPLHFTMLCS